MAFPVGQQKTFQEGLRRGRELPDVDLDDLGARVDARHEPDLAAPLLDVFLVNADGVNPKATAGELATEATQHHFAAGRHGKGLAADSDGPAPRGVARRVGPSVGHGFIVVVVQGAQVLGADVADDGVSEGGAVLQVQDADLGLRADWWEDGAMRLDGAGFDGAAGQAASAIAKVYEVQSLATGIIMPLHCRACSSLGIY